MATEDRVCVHLRTRLLAKLDKRALEKRQPRCPHWPFPASQLATEHRQLVLEPGRARRRAKGPERAVGARRGRSAAGPTLSPAHPEQDRRPHHPVSEVPLGRPVWVAPPGTRCS